MSRLHPGFRAMIEVGILFLPSIPAYLWLWPNLDPPGLVTLVQSLAYLYVLAGCAVIGRRRWSWGQLGLNRRGIGLSLACGAVLIGEDVLARMALGLPLTFRPVSPGGLIGDIAFYFLLVGLVEELLFRGLIYRALADWLNPGLAIAGSALGFGLWHVGWAGPMAMAHVVIGLLFGLIRWRAGGISGLIAVHGLMDLVALQWDPPLGPDRIGQLGPFEPIPALIGDAALLAMVLYLWKGHPRLRRGG
jgi:membrane protease YdiL (CAAX protease family)